MTWNIIWSLEHGHNQEYVADAVEITRCVIAKMWNLFQETGMSYSYEGKITHLLFKKFMIDISC